MATSRNPTQVSEFYLACRKGDVEFVKSYLLTLSATNYDPNQFELSVNSTPLHAASYYGHKEIVKLLIEHGCDRSRKNIYGLTAYEEAANDEIRQLFNRPTQDFGRDRFHDETINDCFDFVKRPKKTTREAATPAVDSQSKITKPPSVQGYKTKAEKQLEIGYSTTSIAMCQSKFGRLLADTFHRSEPMSLRSIGNRLQEIIDKEVVNNNNKDPQVQKANDLLKKFVNDRDNGPIEHLIRLYTLETNFYRTLKQDPMPLAVPLYIALKTLKDRYFQGQSYRGARMDDDDIATYQWAVQNQGSLIQTRHFSSTSLKRSIAENFLIPTAVESTNRPNSVLFVFNFPEKCDQAINLNRISNEQAAISEYENEEEVLILPWALFQVDSVEKKVSSSTSLYTIYLTNILLSNKNMWSSFKWIMKHPKGSIERFHEHFPDK